MCFFVQYNQLGSHVCWEFVALWILTKPLNKSSSASVRLKEGSSSQVLGLQPFNVDLISHPLILSDQCRC